MIGETQREVEVLEEVQFLYHFSLIGISSITSVAGSKVFSTASLDFMCSSNFVLKKPWLKEEILESYCNIDNKACGLDILNIDC